MATARDVQGFAWVPEKNTTTILPTAKSAHAKPALPTQHKPGPAPMQKKPKFIELEADHASEAIEAPRSGSFIDSIFKGQKQRADEEKEKEHERSRKRVRPVEENAAEERGGEKSDARRFKASTPDLNVDVPTLPADFQNEILIEDSGYSETVHHDESRNMKIDTAKSAGGIILKVPNVQGENNNNNRKELDTEMNATIEPQKNRIKIKISAPTYESELKSFQKFQFKQFDLNDLLKNYPYQDISNAAVFKQYTSDYQALHRLHLTIYNDLATNKIHFEKMAEYLKGSADNNAAAKPAEIKEAISELFDRRKAEVVRLRSSYQKIRTVLAELTEKMNNFMTAYLQQDLS